MSTESATAAGVSLREIKNSVPQETQEESIVLEHIEEIILNDDEENDDDGDHDSSRAFGRRDTSSLNKATSLPVIFVESMQEDKRREQQHQHRHQDSNVSDQTIRSVSKSKGTKPKTIEEVLFNLTNSLKPYPKDENRNNNNISIDYSDNNSNNHIASDNGTHQQVEEEEEMLPLTQTEKFANNANNIIENLVTETNYSSKEEEQEREEGFFWCPRTSNAQRKGNNQWQNLQEIKHIIHINRVTTYRYARAIIMFAILPALFVAFLLCYAFKNPLFQVQNLENNDLNGDNGPSWSWLVLFFGLRQVITLSIAIGIQCLVINYYQQPGKSNFNIIGPLTRLFIIQSGGAPLILIFWGILDVILLRGTNSFVNHWAFYSRLKIFNEENPSGLFPANKQYRLVLVFLIGTGVAMSVKRFLIGLRFGQNSYHRYVNRLAVILKQMLQVSMIARLSELKSKLGKDTEHAKRKTEAVAEDTTEVEFWLENNNIYSMDNKNGIVNNDVKDNTFNRDHLGAESKMVMSASENNNISDDENSARTLPLHNNASKLLTSIHFGSEGSIKINELLGEWEEIELAGKRTENPSLSAIVQFGTSLGVLKSDYPFGQYFGYCPTRYECVKCSQCVYSSLLKLQQRVPSIDSITDGENVNSTSSDKNNGENQRDILKFHTIALIARIDETGQLDTDVMKDLMRLFRPTREGEISLVDFCKSIDSVYKEIRKLLASVTNEGMMNAAVERVVDFLFYSTLVILGMAAIGIDVFVIFGFFSATIISFSFCVGGASSEVIKGLLFILLQRPYDIGDRIALGEATEIATKTGSPQWTVTNLTLYHTTLLFAPTMESATLSNGSMANLRIINGNRSPRATLQFYMKFGVSVELGTIEEFKKRLFEYIRSKPREWLRPLAFRLCKIAADLGYVEYFIQLQHREGWQQLACLLDSLSDAQQFSFTLSASLGMDYQSPALPIHLDSTAYGITTRPDNNTSTSDNFVV